MGKKLTEKERNSKKLRNWALFGKVDSVFNFFLKKSHSKIFWAKKNPNSILEKNSSENKKLLQGWRDLEISIPKEEI